MELSLSYGIAIAGIWLFPGLALFSRRIERLFIAIAVSFMTTLFLTLVAAL